MLNLQTRRWYDAIIAWNNYGAVRSTKNNLGRGFPENKRYKVPFRHLPNWRPSEGLRSVLLWCSACLCLHDHSVSSSLTATLCKAACVLTFASAVASTMPGVRQALEILKWVDLSSKNIKWQEKTCSGLDSLVRWWVRSHWSNQEESPTWLGDH